MFLNFGADFPNKAHQHRASPKLIFSPAPSTQAMPLAASSDHSNRENLYCGDSEQSSLPPLSLDLVVWRGFISLVQWLIMNNIWPPDLKSENLVGLSSSRSSQLWSLLEASQEHWLGSFLLNLLGYALIIVPAGLLIRRWKKDPQIKRGKLMILWFGMITTRSYLVEPLMCLRKSKICPGWKCST